MAKRAKRTVSQFSNMASGSPVIQVGVVFIIIAAIALVAFVAKMY